MTLRRAVFALALAAGVLGPTPPASGADDPSMDDWVEDGDAPGSKVIYVRNRSTQPVRVTVYFLFECDNVAGECGPIRNAAKELRPGEIAELAEVRAATPTRGIAFKYRYRVRSGS